MRAFRIADRRFPIFDGTGARIVGGRWNSPGRSVLYASQTFAGAVLEVLVHSNLGRVPKTHDVVEIAISKEIQVEEVTFDALPGWDLPDLQISGSYGDSWLEEQRTAVLLVPSLVTRGREQNILINPAHPDFGRVTASLPQPVVWDHRLFQRRR